MNRRIGLVLVLISAFMMLMGGAQADSDYAVYGGFAVENGEAVYLAVPENGAERLYSILPEGGEAVLLDQAQGLDQLLNTPQGIFYLKEQDAPQIVGESGEALIEFEPGQSVSGLCYYDAAFYCLVDGYLTRIEMDGKRRTLSQAKMDEFVLKGDSVLYSSGEDQREYNQNGESKRAGCLYRLDLRDGSRECLFEAGVEDLKLSGGYLFFHNLEDAYIGSDESGSFLAGRLYRMRLNDQSLQAINCDYDLEYFPTDSGLILRTPWDISRCGLSGGDVKQLLATDQPVNLAMGKSSALVYMRQEGVLLKVPIDGSRARVVGKIVQDQAEYEIETATEESPEAILEDQIEQAYIFPNSDKEKLDRAQVEALDPELLGYARNEIYARHGYEFKNEAYASYFMGKSWYTPGGFSKSALNSIEWYNMDLISSVEEAYNQEEPAQSSDYIFPNSDKYKLTREEIWQVDPALWPYARNEIYARHGYVFKKDQYARYFMSKSWYKPGGFSENSLNSVEWYNMELLSQMESEQAS